MIDAYSRLEKKSEDAPVQVHSPKLILFWIGFNILSISFWGEVLQFSILDYLAIS